MGEFVLVTLYTTNGTPFTVSLCYSQANCKEIDKSLELILLGAVIFIYFMVTSTLHVDLRSFSTVDLLQKLMMLHDVPINFEIVVRGNNAVIGSYRQSYP